MSFTTQIHVGFSDCDPAGIMFFGKIFEMTHSAYETLIAELGFEYDEWFGNAEFAVPIVACGAEYSLPMKPGFNFKATAFIEKIGNSSFSLLWSYSLSSQVHCQVKTTHVFISRANGKKMPIPEKIKNCLNRYLSIQTKPIS